MLEEHRLGVPCRAEPGQNWNVGPADLGSTTWPALLATPLPTRGPWALAARGTHRHTLALGESM